MNGLLPIVRRKRRPLAPGEPAVVPPRKRVVIDAPLVSGELPRAASTRALRVNSPLPSRFDRARPFTRRPEFWALELQDRRRERRGGNSGTFLITQADEKLITEGGDNLTP